MEDARRQAETNISSWVSAATRTHALPWSRRAEVVAIPEYDESQPSKEGVLDLKKGDIVYVLQEDSSGWCGCHKEGSEDTGWFPASALKPAGDSREYDGDDENSRGFDLHGPLTTSDHRAVASPQARCRQTGPVQEAMAIVQAENERFKREKEELKQRVSALEAENRRLIDECDAERRVCEKWAKEKENLEQRFTQAKEKSERDVASAREQLQARTAELARSQDESARKEELLQQLQARLNQLEREPALRDFAAESVLQANSRDVSSFRAEVDDRRMVESSLLSDGGVHGTPHGSGSREDALMKRAAASSVSRQLFTQPVADDAPPNSARGIARTDSAPLQGIPANGHAHHLPGQLPGPRLVTAAPPRPAPSPRNNAPQQRPLHSTPQQPWRSQSHGAAPLISSTASPRNHIGKVGSQATTATVQQPAGDTRPPVQVRAIVSEIERRSTSQTPGPMTRNIETTPGVQRSTPLVAGSTSRTASASASGGGRSSPATVNATAVARAESTRGRRIGDLDSGHGSSPHPAEDRQTWTTQESVAQSQFSLGMSPMGRPRQPERGMPVTTQPIRTAIGPSLGAASPTPKGLTITERMQRLRTAGIQP